MRTATGVKLGSNNKMDQFLGALDSYCQVGSGLQIPAAFVESCWDYCTLQHLQLSCLEGQD